MALFTGLFYQSCLLKMNRKKKCSFLSSTQKRLNTKFEIMGMRGAIIPPSSFNPEETLEMWEMHQRCVIGTTQSSPKQHQILTLTTTIMPLKLKLTHFKSALAVACSKPENTHAHTCTHTPVNVCRIHDFQSRDLTAFANV